MKAVAVYLRLKLKEQFVKFRPEIMSCTVYLSCACSSQEITIIFRDNNIQIFVNEDISLNRS